MGTDTTDKIPTFSDVMDAARRWYYSEIRSIADEAIKECLERHADDSTDDRREALTEWVDETTEGHEFVIYTAQAGMVLAASDNDGAYEDATGEDGGTVEARACMAMRADVWDMLGAREDEWHAPDPDDDDSDDASDE